MDPDLTYASAGRLNYVAWNVPDVGLFKLPAGERKCAICWIAYVQEEPRKPYSQRVEEGAGKLHCGHVFGQHCLEHWIIEEGGNTCPVCRAVIYEGSSDSELDTDGSEDEACELYCLRLDAYGVDFGDITSGSFSDFDRDDDEDGEEQSGGGGADREGRVGWDRTEGKVAKDLEAEEDVIDFGTKSQSDDEGYDQSSENGEEEEYPTFLAGLENGQRTIDDYFGPLKQPPVDVKRET